MRVGSNSFLTLVCAASLVFSLPVGGVQEESLMAKVGENITMQPWTDDLRGNYQILWCIKNGDTKETLFVCDKGEIDFEPPKELEEKLRLNTKTGSLTIGPLSLSDSHVYEAEITDRNSTVHRYIYTLTVSEAQTATPSPDSAHSRRPSLGLLLMAALLVLCCCFFTV